MAGHRFPASNRTVKGMRLQCVSEVQLEQHGVFGDREFLVIGHDGKLFLTGRRSCCQSSPAGTEDEKQRG